MDKVELDGVYKEHIFKYLKEKKTSINSMIITDMPKGTF